MTILEAALAHASYLGREGYAAKRARRRDWSEKLYAQSQEIRAQVEQVRAALDRNDIYGDQEAVNLLRGDKA